MCTYKMTIRPGSSSRPPAKVTNRMSFRRSTKSNWNEGGVPGAPRPCACRGASVGLSFRGWGSLLFRARVVSTIECALTKKGRGEGAHGADPFCSGRLQAGSGIRACERNRVASRRNVSRMRTYMRLARKWRRMNTCTKMGRGEGPRGAVRAIISLSTLGGDWPWISLKKSCGLGAKASAP